MYQQIVNHIKTECSDVRVRQYFGDERAAAAGGQTRAHPSGSALADLISCDGTDGVAVTAIVVAPTDSS